MQMDLIARAEVLHCNGRAFRGDDRVVLKRHDVRGRRNVAEAHRFAGEAKLALEPLAAAT